MLIRHGDVLIQTVRKIPINAVALPHAILAHGEVTGHSHRISDPNGAELFESAGTLFLKVKSQTVALTHEEHATIQIPAGDYKVWRQREYHPQEIRIIRD